MSLEAILINRYVIQNSFNFLLAKLQKYKAEALKR